MSWQPTYMEYQVVEVKDSLFRGKQSAENLQNVLNEQARAGWKFRSMMSTDLKGRMGLGTTDGVLITFEREVAAPS